MNLPEVFWQLDSVQPLNVVVVAHLDGLFDPRLIPAELPHTSAPRQTPLDWCSRAAAELMTGFDGTGPLMRLGVLEAPDATDLVLVYHHAIGDALSGVYFLEDLLAGVPLQMVQGRRGPVRRRAPMWQSEILPLRLGRREVDALAVRCRENRTTVHGALASAALDAARECWGQGEFLCTSPVSLRRGGDRAFGLRVADAAVSVKAGEFWDMARQVVAGVREQFRAGDLEAQGSRLERLEQVRMGAFSRSQIGVSNLGRLPVRTPVRAMHFAATPPTPEMLLCAASAGDGLFLNLVYPRPYVQTAEAVSFGDALMARLRAAGLSEARQRLIERLMRGPSSATFPLSHGQRAMWFLRQIAPQSPAYNQPFAAWIRGEVDVARLRAAFRTLMERHAVLRMAFPAADGEPAQKLLPDPDLPWTHSIGYDDQAVREFYTRPFDLENSPAWRAALFTRTAGEHLLVVVLHHIASDFWSLMVLIAELRDLYAGRPLPAAAPPYAAYVKWQAQWLQSSDGEAAAEYWRQQLAGDLPVLELPSDHPRPAVERLEGACHTFTWGAERVEAVRSLARQNNVTLFTALLALYQALLHRYSGQNLFFVGSPLAGRSNPEFARTAGDFINPVALRAEFPEGCTVAGHIARVRDTVLGALTHGEYPFPLAVQQLAIRRDASRSPVFQAIFVLQNQVGFLESRVGGGDGLRLDPWRIPVEGAQFDLALEFQEKSADLEGTWKFNTGLFDRDTILGINASLEALVDTAAADPGARIGSLPLVSPGRKRRILEEWNRTEADYGSATFLDLFAAQVHAGPERIAVSCQGRTLTYAELDRLSTRRAAAFRRGRRVGVSMERTEALLVELIAIWKAGSVYVPLDLADPAARRDYIRADARLDDETPSEGAYIIYTSGSTGKPKGVLVGHLAVANFLCSMRDRLGIAEQHRFAALTNLSFDISVLEIFLPLIAGASVEMLDRAAALDADFRGCTHAQATPATWRILLDGGWRPQSGVVLLSGGETLSRDLANQLLQTGSTVWNLYGPTETTVWSTMAPVEAGDGPVPIGRPIANTRIYILDSSGQPAPERVPGQLYIAGRGLAEGYWNRPELTAARFVADPFHPGERMYRTGDLARYFSGGAIELLGREDSQFKLRGFRIEPGEIEAALRAHPQIREAVAGVREAGPAGRHLCAWYAASAAVDPPALRAHLRLTLPEHMIPGEFCRVDAFPLTSSGKIDRSALHTMAPEASPRPVPQQGAAGEIAAIWCELLGRDAIGTDDNFFDLGGHSLLLGQMQARLRTRLNLDLPITEILRCGTVRALAERAAQQPGMALSGVGERARQQRAALGRQRLARGRSA